MTTKPCLYGLIAEFTEPEDLRRAAQRAREEGYRHVRAYTPFPVEGLPEALGIRGSWLPFIVFIGGIVGAAVGFFMQYYSAVIDYPFDIGGRPHNSWPMFIPVTIEVAILFAGVAALVGMFLLNGLPQLYHPIFNASGFELASRNRFFLCIQARDPRFDRKETRRFLQSLGPQFVSEVEC